MLEELDMLVKSFDSLDTTISALVSDLVQKQGVTEDVVQAHFEKLMSGIVTPHDPKKIQKSVVITAAVEWRVGETVKCGILFTSGVGNLVLGERGLCFGPQDVPAEHLKLKNRIRQSSSGDCESKTQEGGSVELCDPAS